MKVHKINNRTIWVEEPESIYNLNLDILYGINTPYYRIEMPDDCRIITPITLKVNLFTKPSMKSKIIRVLIEEERVDVIERGNEEKINGIFGTWMKVKTRKGETGWVFFDGKMIELYE